MTTKRRLGSPRSPSLQSSTVHRKWLWLWPSTSTLTLQGKMSHEKPCWPVSTDHCLFVSTNVLGGGGFPPTSIISRGVKLLERCIQPVGLNQGEGWGWKIE
jgi:hypothetical protein